jgi:hypothetical protein
VYKVEGVAWNNYIRSRKAPFTEKAGPGFADPSYDLSVEWRAVGEMRAGRLPQPDAMLKTPRPK